jgi:hypothetical protein
MPGKAPVIAVEEVNDPEELATARARRALRSQRGVVASARSRDLLPPSRQIRLRRGRGILRSGDGRGRIRIRAGRTPGRRRQLRSVHPQGEAGAGVCKSAVSGCCARTPFDVRSCAVRCWLSIVVGYPPSFSSTPVPTARCSVPAYSRSLASHLRRQSGASVGSAGSHTRCLRGRDGRRGARHERARARITGMFAVIVDQPDGVVCLLGQRHRYRVEEV